MSGEMGQGQGWGILDAITSKKKTKKMEIKPGLAGLLCQFCCNKEKRFYFARGGVWRGW